MSQTPLKEKRIKTRLTQAAVSRNARVNERMYQYYEAGEREPGVRAAIRIADTLGVVDLRELFETSSVDDKDKTA